MCYGMSELTNDERQIVLLWVLSCEDLQAPEWNGGCEKCNFRDICKEVRRKLKIKS